LILELIAWTESLGSSQDIMCGSVDAISVKNKIIPEKLRQNPTGRLNSVN
jgi:hypothetical protein